MAVKRTVKQQELAKRIYSKVATPKTSRELQTKIYGMVTWSTQFLRNTSQSNKVPNEQRLAAQEILALRMPNMKSSNQMNFKIDNWAKNMYDSRYTTAYRVADRKYWTPYKSFLKGGYRTRHIMLTKTTIRTLNNIPTGQRKANHKSYIDSLRATIRELEAVDDEVKRRSGQ